MATKWEEKQISLGGAIVAGAVTLIIGVLVGINWNSFAGKFLPYLGFQMRINNDWSALDEVYTKLIAEYDGDIDKTALVEGAKKGMVASLGDIYTSYMPADEAKEYQSMLHGDVGAGIGVEMGLRDGYVRVVRTLPNNPALKAGVQAGDIIYKVDGEEVYTLDTEAIAGKLRGPANTKVKLTVVRNGEEKEFELTRETINNVSAYVDYDDTTAIITVTRFDTDTGNLVRQIATSDDFKKRGVKKIILDLRSNGGGYVSAAKDLLSLWLDGDLLLTQASKKTGDVKTYANRGQATLANIPTVVLMNNNTASASEIVAGALKDYGKATLIGETTFGKGVVQTLLNLSGNSLLKVTTARWYTPKGTSINGQGITPDMEVKLSYDDANRGRDPQLDAAKKYSK